MFAIKLPAATTPRLRLITMSADHRRNTDMAPPLDDDARDTLPPDADDSEAERVMGTMLPPGGTPAERVATADSLLMDLIRQVADAARAIHEGREERQRVDRTQAEMQEQILHAVEKADRNSQNSYAMLRDELRHLKDSDRQQNARLAEGDERFASIERSIKNLKDELIAHIERLIGDAVQRIEALETELTKARNDATAPTAAPT